MTDCCQYDTKVAFENQTYELFIETALKNALTF